MTAITDSIVLRPPAGWDDATVPISIGRDYWRWCMLDPARNKWRVDGVRDLVSDFVDDEVMAWQYADIHAAMGPGAGTAPSGMVVVGTTLCLHLNYRFDQNTGVASCLLCGQVVP